jgi:uncharacterized protein
MTRRTSPRRPILLLAMLHAFLSAVSAQTPPLTPDIPAKYTTPPVSYDYVKREVMIPMRDGVKLHTVIFIPNGAKNAPIILDVSKRAERNRSPHATN